MSEGFFNNYTPVKTTFPILKQQLASYLEQTIVPYFHQAKQSIQTLLQHSKTFYKQHKSIILILSAITVTYILTKKSNKQVQTQRKRKNQVQKVHLGIKNFMSDDEDVIKQQQSTQQRKQGYSSKQGNTKKKRVIQVRLEKIQSSQQQQQNGDKLFFQLYKTYQNQQV